jgi:hypothetical protein
VSPRAASRVGWTLFGITAVAAAFQFAARLPNLDEMGRHYDPYLTFPIITLATLAAALVGAVVVSRHPRNPVGWLFCAVNCLAEVGLAGETYAELSGLRDTPLPGAGWAAFVQTFTGAPFALAGLAMLLLLFPAGRLPGPGWRLVAWGTVLGLVVFEAGVFALPGAAGDTPPTSRLEPEGAVALVLTVGQLGILVCLLAAAASVVLRLRRAEGDERQQLRLVTVAVCVLGAAVVGLAVYEALLARLGIARLVPETLFYLAYGGLPVAAGLAILKYRLYDIDIILNRTVVYTGLAAVSTVAYVAAVVAVASVVGDRMHSGTVVDLVVTAAVPVAVQPARRRVVRVADRVAYGTAALLPVRRARGLHRPGGEHALRRRRSDAHGRRARRASAPLSAASRSGSRAAPSAASCGPRRARSTGHDVVDRLRARGGPEVGSSAWALSPGHALSRESQALLTTSRARPVVALHNVRLTVATRGAAAAAAQRTHDLGASRRRLLAARRSSSSASSGSSTSRAPTWQRSARVKELAVAGGAQSSAAATRAARRRGHRGPRGVAGHRPGRVPALLVATGCSRPWTPRSRRRRRG